MSGRVWGGGSAPTAKVILPRLRWCFGLHVVQSPPQTCLGLGASLTEAGAFNLLRFRTLAYMRVLIRWCPSRPLYSPSLSSPLYSSPASIAPHVHRTALPSLTLASLRSIVKAVNALFSQEQECNNRNTNHPNNHSRTPKLIAAVTKALAAATKAESACFISVDPLTRESGTGPDASATVVGGSSPDNKQHKRLQMFIKQAAEEDERNWIKSAKASLGTNPTAAADRSFTTTAAAPSGVVQSEDDAVRARGGGDQLRPFMVVDVPIRDDGHQPRSREVYDFSLKCGCLPPAQADGGDAAGTGSGSSGSGGSRSRSGGGTRMNRGGQRRQRRVNLHYEASDDDASMIIERVVRLFSYLQRQL